MKEHLVELRSWGNDTVVRSVDVITLPIDWQIGIGGGMRRPRAKSPTGSGPRMTPEISVISLEDKVLIGMLNQRRKNSTSSAGSDFVPIRKPTQPSKVFADTKTKEVDDGVKVIFAAQKWHPFVYW